ncbi:YppE family protein [Neobacillus sp. NRS-1170]|uniref:YppE family protein n=1 Tax=Neobacillus sp. NRS-1170 TaxID=3233898 RepID=UPI003D2C4E85
MKTEIIDLTEKLLQYNRLFLKYYQEGREQGIKYDFHETIKPFADEVKIVNDQWKDAIKAWLKKGSHKHIHGKQIDTTSEHIAQLSIQCFFPESSRTRFLNTHRTIEYFLLEILKVNK